MKNPHLGRGEGTDEHSGQADNSILADSKPCLNAPECRQSNPLERLGDEKVHQACDYYTKLGREWFDKANALLKADENGDYLLDWHDLDELSEASSSFKELLNLFGNNPSRDLSTLEQIITRMDVLGSAVIYVLSERDSEPVEQDSAKAIDLSGAELRQAWDSYMQTCRDIRLTFGNIFNNQAVAGGQPAKENVLMWHPSGPLGSLISEANFWLSERDAPPQQLDLEWLESLISLKVRLEQGLLDYASERGLDD